MKQTKPTMIAWILIFIKTIKEKRLQDGKERRRLKRNVRKNLAAPGTDPKCQELKFIFVLLAKKT